jgi:hypothetical protein
MPRLCSICYSIDRLAIDRELSAGGAIATIAAVYGVSPDSLRRHRSNHLLPGARDRLAEDSELKDVDVLAEVRGLYRQMQRYLERAEEADSWPAVRAFHAEARRDLELLAKLVGDLDMSDLQQRIEQLEERAKRVHGA